MVTDTLKVFKRLINVCQIWFCWMLINTIQKSYIFLFIHKLKRFFDWNIIWDFNFIVQFFSNTIIQWIIYFFEICDIKYFSGDPLRSTTVNTKRAGYYRQQKSTCKNRWQSGFIFYSFQAFNELFNSYWPHLSHNITKS